MEKVAAITTTTTGEKLSADKNHLAEKIKKTADEIFSLCENEASAEDHSAEWKTLATKLTADVWKYAVLLFGKDRTEICGVEVTQPPAKLVA